jgi:hypothetical protein
MLSENLEILNCFKPSCKKNFFFITSILISWYPIGSYSLVSSLQLPYGLRRDEGREPCVLRNTTRISCTASKHSAHPTRKPAAPMCLRKHRFTAYYEACVKVAWAKSDRIRGDKHFIKTSICHRNQ